MSEDRGTIRETFADADAFDVEETTGTEVAAGVTTTAFDATVTARAEGDRGVTVTVTVEMPTLRTAVRGEDVGPALLDGWTETLERRLADAPKATRARVDLDEYDFESDGERIVVTYEYTFGDVREGIQMAKTFVEYVEGTYVQGIVPGFEYDSPVSDLLREAGQSDGGPGGTPL